MARAVARVKAAGAFTTMDHLASPEYAGRLTGTGGYEAAAAWIAEECKQAGLKADGKVVMILRGESKDGRDWKDYNTTAAREANAKAHGAVAFLMVDQPVLSANGHPVEGLPAAMISEDLANQLLAPQKLKGDELRRVLEKGGRHLSPQVGRCALR